jgi:hypothetical protein
VGGAERGGPGDDTCPGRYGRRAAKLRLFASGTAAQDRVRRTGSGKGGVHDPAIRFDAGTPGKPRLEALADTFHHP